MTSLGKKTDDIERKRNLINHPVALNKHWVRSGNLENYLWRRDSAIVAHAPEMIKAKERWDMFNIYLKYLKI